MSDLWLNVRVLCWHIQWGPRGFEVLFNKYWVSPKLLLSPFWIHAFHPIGMLIDMRDEKEYQRQLDEAERKLSNVTRTPK